MKSECSFNFIANSHIWTPYNVDSLLRVQRDLFSSSGDLFSTVGYSISTREKTF